MVKKINTAEFKQEAMTGLAIIDFSAVWCGPCKMMAPVLEEISEELAGQAKFFNVDCDENMMLAMEYQISSIPALLILKDGQKQGMLVGFQPKPVLLQKIKAYL